MWSSGLTSQHLFCSHATMAEQARVAVIELAHNDAQRQPQPPAANLVIHESSSPTDLETYLAASSSSPNLQRIILVEWAATLGDAAAAAPPPPQPRRHSIRGVLETKLGIPVEVFQEHASHGLGFEPRENQIIKSYLPTARPAEESWCITLYTLLEYTGTAKDLQFPCPLTRRILCPGDAGLTLVCDATERQLQLHKWRAREQRWLIIAPRKCSYWSKRNDNGVGWTVVIIVDPTPKAAAVLWDKGPDRKSDPVSLKQQSPFLGGYHEFVPREIAVDGGLSDVTRETLRTPDQPTLTPPPGEQVQAQIAMQRVSGSIQRQHDYNIPLERITTPSSEEEDETEDQRKARILADLEKPVSPRTSLLDDLRYYFTRHSQLLLPDHHHPRTRSIEPCMTTLFPLKLIASHYCLLHSFVAFQTAMMRSTGWSVKRETPQQDAEAAQVETAWSRFRCSEYLEAIEALMDTLGIPYHSAEMDSTFLVSSNPYNLTSAVLCPRVCCSSTNDATEGGESSGIEARGGGGAWKSAAADFSYLHRQFSIRRQDYGRITTSIAALAGIITGRVALSEAKTAKSLTYVAMLFAPLAWVAALYSLPQAAPYQTYWATAIPVTALVWALLLGWHNRHRVVRIVRGVRVRLRLRKRRRKSAGDMV
ncbi:hypothetical protein B0H66DRAFT_357648 [Apodospora peruviana]|uniref:Uncharacterized protein n=1 Tax=Apodospora peruviana TaxID=516989 RepID=A0AAE0HVH8_9PEZI|nr:hypothetical protein B0H66DRAFT_357648 [Apodospora peruviana]